MNALCILYSVKVRVEKDRAVPLYDPDTSELVAALRPAPLMVAGTITEDGWMLVSHPEKGLLGLPVLPDNRFRTSWKDQWENENVTLEVCTADGWVPVEDWSLIQTALNYTANL